MKREALCCMSHEVNVKNQKRLWNAAGLPTNRSATRHACVQRMPATKQTGPQEACVHVDIFGRKRFVRQETLTKAGTTQVARRSIRAEQQSVLSPQVN